MCSLFVSSRPRTWPSSCVNVCSLVLRPSRTLRPQVEARRGLDPNVWFGNVEQVASARVGRETVDYVSNIFKYYVAYRLVIQEEERREAIRAKIGDRR